VDHAGILVHDGTDGHLDGFCWTRVHHIQDASAANHSGSEARDIGEIWVIGVDPNQHRRGLGPGLVTAGLDYLSGLGLRAVILYTEESNLPALRMYERMGFVVSERRGGYR
jgi:mycothiol synthase